MLYKFLPVCITFIFAFSLNAQTNHVLHKEGSKVVNGVNITVTHKGYVLELYDLSYCNAETGPYYFGTDYERRYGNYTFTFSPPIDGLTLNFTGLTASDDHMEEIQLFINNKHYAIPEKGSKINCEEMAVLTTEGNIRPCNGCGVSGWKGTKIEGPIERLIVADTIISGAPAGVLFALWIGDPVIEPVIQFTATNKIKYDDIAAGKGVLIESKNYEAANLILKNGTGDKIEFNFDLVKDFEHILLFSKKLVIGSYTLEIWLGEKLLEKQEIIVE